MAKVTFIDLREFRQTNSLNQQDIADLLGVSRAYVSLTEGGHSKLSRKKVDRLFDLCADPESGITGIETLVPCYFRLKEAIEYVNSTTTNNFTVSDKVLQRVKYGETDIPAPLIEALVTHCPSFSREWLVNGIGSMLADSSETNTLDALLERIVRLESQMARVVVLLEKIVEKN